MVKLFSSGTHKEANKHLYLFISTPSIHSSEAGMY